MLGEEFVLRADAVDEGLAERAAGDAGLDEDLCAELRFVAAVLAEVADDVSALRSGDGQDGIARLDCLAGAAVNRGDAAVDGGADLKHVGFGLKPADFGLLRRNGSEDGREPLFDVARRRIGKLGQPLLCLGQLGRQFVPGADGRVARFGRFLALELLLAKFNIGDGPGEKPGAKRFEPGVVLPDLDVGKFQSPPHDRAGRSAMR